MTDPSVTREILDPAAWRALADDPAAELLALWADTVEAHALWRIPFAPLPRAVSVGLRDGAYPALSPARPAAAWFERAIHDLFGHVATGAADLRPWLDHGAWEVARPLGPRPAPHVPEAEQFPFLETAAEGLQTIPLGPVHADIAEPAHLRFTVDGEAVARLEARLGYAHKGTMLLMRGKTPRVAARFAARMSGDSTVAHSVAFARATEAATGTDAPPRAQSLRGVAGEVERLANHCGDLGAIAQQAAFAPLATAMGLLREAVCRAANEAFGHRLMMDCVIPGGMAADLLPGGADALERAIDAVAAQWPGLVRLYRDSASLADRTIGTGVIPPARADAMAAGGVVGRASNRAVDARLWPGYPPYDDLAEPDRVRIPTRPEGDVHARMEIRFAELGESLRLIRLLLSTLPGGPVSVPLPMAGGEGFGWAEGFRGDVWHWLRLDGGLIGAVFARDPSWLHWPLLEEAMRTTGLADVALLHGSVNAACSGADL